MKSLFASLIVLAGFTFAFAQDEQVPIRELKFKYKDWTYKSVRDASDVNLREFTKGKKLVLVVYFAPWCHNWAHEAPFVQKLYEKYKSNGLDVIGVGEYDTVEAMKADLEKKKITFQVVYESESKDSRLTTLHYGYRTVAGDTRKWGSPWNVFLLPREIKQKGDTLTKKAPIASGELIEAEAERFVRETLGLPAETIGNTQGATKSLEPCEEDKTAGLKKPGN